MSLRLFDIAFKSGRFTTAGAVLASGLLLAACGGGGAGSGTSAGGAGTPAAASSPGSGSSGSVTFSGDLTLTGTVAATGSWTDSAEAWSGGCQNWATTSRVGAGPMNVPGPGGPAGATVGGHEVGIAFVFTTYRGPGTYTSDPANKGLDVDGHTYGPPASYTLKVNADGSGSLTFTGAADPLDSSKVESGSETWTCR